TRLTRHTTIRRNLESLEQSQSGVDIGGCRPTDHRRDDVRRRRLKSDGPAKRFARLPPRPGTSESAAQTRVAIALSQCVEVRAGLRGIALGEGDERRLLERLVTFEP